MTFTGIPFRLDSKKVSIASPEETVIHGQVTAETGQLLNSTKSCDRRFNESETGFNDP